MHWNKITLIGVGLLGGSLGLALRQRRLANSVVGLVRRRASVSECRRVGAVDVATLDLVEAVKDADMIVLCTPISAMMPLTRQMAPHLKPGAIVTDVGSVKGSVIRDLEKLVSGAGGHFVGSHPMAGSEKNGVGAARADLFANAICVVTPSARSNPKAVQKVEKLWKSVGARTLRLQAGLHDELVSRSSHLPHIVAAALANYVLHPARPREQELLCANGFRDTTRIASSSPEMWRDIVLANRRQLARSLGEFIVGLKKVQRAIETSDAKSLTRFLQTAKRRRDNWRSRAATVSPE